MMSCCSVDGHEEIKGWNEKAETDFGIKSRQRGVVVVMVALRSLAVVVLLLVGIRRRMQQWPFAGIRIKTEDEGVGGNER